MHRVIYMCHTIMDTKYSVYFIILYYIILYYIILYYIILYLWLHTTGMNDLIIVQ